MNGEKESSVSVYAYKKMSNNTTLCNFKGVAVAQFVDRVVCKPQGHLMIDLIIGSSWLC